MVKEVEDLPPKLQPKSFDKPMSKLKEIAAVERQIYNARPSTTLPSVELAVSICDARVLTTTDAVICPSPS